MAEHSTFIKIDRNIVEWRWFKDSRVFHVFSWLLIKANVKDHDFMKNKIPRGSLATSYESIAIACGMSISSVRRAIANLEATEEIKREVKDHYQIIKIVNYDAYQGCSNRTGKPQPLEQPLEQANNRQTATIKEYKNDKNEKKNIPPKSPKGDFTPSGGKEPERDDGVYDDIPVQHRDGTFHSFKTYAEYWDWANQ